MRLAAALLLLSVPALGQTPCPSVSDNVSLLPVNIVNAPKPISYAALDLETDYLFISYSDRSGQMLIGVPRGMVQSGQVQWANLTRFPSAIMQERSTCPLLTQNNVPILVQ